ncbi:hypothetical protein ACFQNE_14170 [Gordonia phosphorivorans]|uniref:Uncharacterized protein n=1 Tax=Gordonia phosphorivorans TaxID=1056982 RepID=A0ABV6HAA5_9ACTN
MSNEPLRRKIAADQVESAVRLALAAGVDADAVVDAALNGGLPSEAITDRLTCVTVGDLLADDTSYWFGDTPAHVRTYRVDPGAGYTRTEWEQSRADALDGTSGAVRAALTVAYDDAADSVYITDGTHR